MNDYRDPLLAQLFADQGRPAHDSDFMAQVINRLERDGRNRRIYRISMIIAAAILTALLAPWIALVAAAAIGSVAAGVAEARSSLNFPMAWLVVCSALATLLPVIYLGTTRRW